MVTRILDRPEPRTGHELPFSLGSFQRDTLEALCRTIVPHAFSEELSREDEGLAAAVERRLAASDPAIARRVALALRVVGHPLSALITGGRLRRFAALSGAERDQALGTWRDSGVAQRRMIYQGLRRLILSTHYASREALAEVGWKGPLHARTPEFAWEGPIAGSPSDDEPILRAAAEEPSGVAGAQSPPFDPRGITSARDRAEPTSLRAGVCVIGSGAGGAVVAARLAEQGHDVIVLEEGSRWNPLDFTEREADMMPRLYADGGLRATEDLSMTVLQGRAVGGSALVNWLVMLRTPEWVLDEWRRDHGAEGLTAAELAPVFARIEAETHTRCVPDDAHSPANRALLEGARALGWSARAGSINADGCVRAGTCGLGCRWDAKRGPATVYLPRAVRGGARLITECRVDRLEMVGRGAQPLKRVHCSAVDRDTGQAVGRLTIESPVVVLAAGAVGTPSILLRSGLGGPATGRFLRLHPTTAVVGRYARTMYAAAGIPISAICDEFHSGADGYGFWIECPPLYPAFASAALPGWGASHRGRMLEFERLGPLISLVRDGADRSRSSGDVRLDRRGAPRLRYRLTEADRRTLVRGVQAAATVHLSAGASEAFTLHERPHAVRSRVDIAELDRLDFSPNRFAMFSAHVMGSCRLGVDGATSVCMPDGAVRGVAGLYVADGSLLPTAPAVNPQETIMAVASVLAGRIGERHAPG